MLGKIVTRGTRIVIPQSLREESTALSTWRPSRHYEEKLVANQSLVAHDRSRSCTSLEGLPLMSSGRRTWTYAAGTTILRTMESVAIDVLGSSSSFGGELAYNYWFPQPFLWSSYHAFSHVSDDYRSTNANLYTVWIPIQSYLGQRPSVCVRGSWKSLSYTREPTPKMFTFLVSSYNDEVGRQKRRFLKSLKLAEAEKKI